MQFKGVDKLLVESGKLLAELSLVGDVWDALESTIS
jgi:hypothetical protein